MALGYTFTKRRKVLRSAETMKEKEYLIDLFENPVRFLESKYGYYVPETRKPIRHQAWEQQLLQAVVSSEKKIRAIGDIKKNLKTTKAAEVVYLTALKYPNSEIYIISNDFEQSKSRVFHYLLKSLELNPYINAGITQNQITFSNGTYVKALPSDYRGEAGANPTTNRIRRTLGLRVRKCDPHGRGIYAATKHC